MTQQIATYIALNTKKVLFVLGVSLALVFSAALAPAHAAPGDACDFDTDCSIDELCNDADAVPNNNDGTCVADNGSAVSNGDDPAATQYGIDEYKDDIGLGTKPLDDAVVGLINVLLGFLGLIAVVIILIGGFRWMTAGGNEDKVAEARKTIFSGIIGLAIILFAWGITTFVVQELVKAST